MGAFFSPVDISLLSTRSPSSYLFCFLFYLFCFFLFCFFFSFGKMEPGLDCTMGQYWSGPSGQGGLSGGWNEVNGRQNVLEIHEQWARALRVCECVDGAFTEGSARAATFSSYCLTCPNCSIKWNAGDYRGLMSFLFMLLQRIKEGASCCCDQKELPGAAPQRLDSARLC